MPKRPTHKTARRRANRRSKIRAVAYEPGTLRKPSGDLAMMLGQMHDAEVQAQVQAETAVKVRRRIVDWLRARRLAGNIPLDNVAAAVGRHVISLVRVENGTTVAKDSTLTKLLAYHGFDWISTPKLFTSTANGPKHRTE